MYIKALGQCCPIRAIDVAAVAIIAVVPAVITAAVMMLSNSLL